jgi:REP element-mobilizing transposase RayT
MPRNPRLFIRGGTHHVNCRGARGEFVLDDDCEAIEFVETLRETRDLDGWSNLGWCLMGNHYHLVAKIRNVDLLKGARHTLMMSRDLRVPPRPLHTHPSR